jgi:hypothetical protein
MRNLDDVKASTKKTVSVPQDFTSFVFQLEAYSFASKNIFGETSFLTNQLHPFVKNIRKYSIDYKSCIAGDKYLTAKPLLAVDEQVNLFLEELRRCDDCKNVKE